jgi:hypothetical protein
MHAATPPTQHHPHTDYSPPRALDTTSKQKSRATFLAKRIEAMVKSISIARTASCAAVLQ